VQIRVWIYVEVEGNEQMCRVSIICSKCSEAMVIKLALNTLMHS